MGKIWEVPNLPYLEARKSEKITNNMGKIVLVGTVIFKEKENGLEADTNSTKKQMGHDKNR